MATDEDAPGGIGGGRAFTFAPPPDCPVFRPTAAEFEDPLMYIRAIRDRAEAHGIAKIIPPKGWKPHFMPDMDKFRFRPRTQIPSELDASSRLKFNFLEAISKFWDLQGSPLTKYPVIANRTLDLYQLHKSTEALGGYAVVAKKRLWREVARQLKYNSSQCTAQVKANYLKYIRPYTIFLAEQEERKASAHDGADAAEATRSSTAKRSAEDDLDRPGKKARQQGDEQESATTADGDTEAGTGQAPSPSRSDASVEEMCQICGKGDRGECLLLCDMCDKGYHTMCLTPKLLKVPRGDWRCPDCLRQECEKPLDPYGFDQARRTYSLTTFEKMATAFERKVFRKKKVETLTTAEREVEFWRLVTAPEGDKDEALSVEYGADLKASDLGSGFPHGERTRADTSEHRKADAKIAKSPWNLNNLPTLPGSVLGTIRSDISGMTTPWLYVGMLFSSFCWHIEDHWTYSINYLHWGAPKVWYGIPGSSAARFEDELKSAMPELFDEQPDLLHQLVTLVSPAFLARKDVPVFRCSQGPGEFVITCPRAYHAGFNSGFNFAEAVNFAPGNWIPSGQDCIRHYQLLRKAPVFSHDELLVDIARACQQEGNIITAEIAQFALPALKRALAAEEEQRAALAALPRATRDIATLSDEQRTCSLCRALAFFSLVECSVCAAVACLNHAPEACDCGPDAQRRLVVTHDTSGKAALFQALESRMGAFLAWRRAAEALLARTYVPGQDACAANSSASSSTSSGGQGADADADAMQGAEARDGAPAAEAPPRASVQMQEVQAVKKQAEFDWKLSPTYLRLKKLVTRANVLREETRKLVRSATRKSLERPEYAAARRTVRAVRRSGCAVDEADELARLVDAGEALQARAREVTALGPRAPLATLEAMEAELAASSLALPEERGGVEAARRELEWQAAARQLLAGEAEIPFAELAARVDEGRGFQSADEATLGLLGTLAELKDACDSWQKDADLIFGGLPDQESLQTLMDRAGRVKPPRFGEVCALLGRVQEWNREADRILDGEPEDPAQKFPLLLDMTNLVDSAKQAKVKIPRLRLIESRVKGAQAWLKRVRHAFMKRNCRYHLKDVLLATGTPADYDRLDKLRAKHKADEESQEAQFCVCRSKSTGFMIACELCDGWYHGRCMSFTEKMSQAGIPFVCGLCARTRRPKVDPVKNLIAAAKGLTVHLPEVDMIRNLVAEAETWCAEADAVLAVPDRPEADLPMLERVLQRGHMLELDTGTRRQRLTEIVAVLKGEDEEEEEEPPEQEPPAEVTSSATTQKVAGGARAAPGEAGAPQRQPNGGLPARGAAPSVVAAAPPEGAGPPDRLPAAPALPSPQGAATLVPAHAAAAPDQPEVYCICRQPAGKDFMLMCEDCEEWFHGRCVNISAEEAQDIDKYYCPQCAAKRGMALPAALRPPHQSALQRPTPGPLAGAARGAAPPPPRADTISAELNQYANPVDVAMATASIADKRLRQARREVLRQQLRWVLRDRQAKRPRQDLETESELGTDTDEFDDEEEDGDQGGLGVGGSFIDVSVPEGAALALLGFRRHHKRHRVS